MYICLCNPFTDKDVDRFLSGTMEKVTVGQVYQCCSGGESPNCCRCIQSLKDVVHKHNKRVATRHIGLARASASNDLPEAAEKKAV